MRISLIGRKIGGTKEKTDRRIIEATIRCLAQFGHKGTSFQRIALIAEISPAMVVQYFKTIENVFPAAYEHFIKFAQETTHAKMQTVHESARDQLVAYIQVSFALFKNSGDGTTVYLMMYYFGLFDRRSKEINERVKSQAIDRIAGIIKLGIIRKEFTTSARVEAARPIHDLLIGTLISAATAESTPDFDELERLVTNSALLLLGYRKPTQPLLNGID